jgi:predicted dehydrogenase
LGPAPKAWDEASLPEYQELKTKQGLPCFEFKLSAPAADKGTFRLIKAKFMDQSGAQQLCKAEGGSLASIHSGHALDALRYVMSDFGWPSVAGLKGVGIGLHSDGPGQPLKWYDGSPVDFTKLPMDFPQKTERILGALFVVSGSSGAAYFFHSVFQHEAALCKLP